LKFEAAGYTTTRSRDQVDDFGTARLDDISLLEGACLGLCESVSCAWHVDDPTAAVRWAFRYMGCDECPPGDHSYGTGEGKAFVVARNDQKRASGILDTATLVSPVQTEAENQCVKFFYMIYRDDYELKAYVRAPGGAINEGSPNWKTSSDQLQVWFPGQFYFWYPNYHEVQTK
jgi:hypothetical protein